MGRPALGGFVIKALGTLLAWMAERNTLVFLVATANDINRLPPELVHKGRIDELFFVDLPRAAVRAEAFAIHLRNRGLDPTGFDLPHLAQASEGFTGAGSEQAVVSARYAVDATTRAPDTCALLNELGRTQPLSVVMAEQIEALRDWARELCVPAYGPLPTPAALPS